jgi:CRP/FNR family cyclic AMP-dependent transcriptional regulator
MTIKPGMVVDLLIRLGVPLTDFPADKVLIREGTKGTNVYVLHEGEVSITQEFSEIAIIQDQGAMLGEIAALLGIERTATVTTTTDCTFFVIEDLQAFIDEHPKATIAVLKNMAQQILDRDKAHPGVYIGLKRLRRKQAEE